MPATVAVPAIRWPRRVPSYVSSRPSCPISARSVDVLGDAIRPKRAAGSGRGRSAHIRPATLDPTGEYRARRKSHRERWLIARARNGDVVVNTRGRAERYTEPLPRATRYTRSLPHHERRSAWNSPIDPGRLRRPERLPCGFESPAVSFLTPMCVNEAVYCARSSSPSAEVDLRIARAEPGKRRRLRFLDAGSDTLEALAPSLLPRVHALSAPPDAPIRLPCSLLPRRHSRIGLRIQRVVMQVGPDGRPRRSRDSRVAEPEPSG